MLLALSSHRCRLPPIAVACFLELSVSFVLRRLYSYELGASASTSSFLSIQSTILDSEGPRHISPHPRRRTQARAFCLPIPHMIFSSDNVHYVVQGRVQWRLAGAGSREIQSMGSDCTSGWKSQRGVVFQEWSWIVISYPDP